MMKKIWFALVPLTLSVGCASRAHRVPEINSSNLPNVEFKTLAPRALKLDVHNTRVAVNEAGNAGSVEYAVRRALEDAFTRSGVTVQNDAPNSMMVTVADYDKATKEDGECVQLFADMLLKGGSTVKSQAFACQSKTGIGGLQLRGDFNKAYEGALRGLLRATDKKL